MKDCLSEDVRTTIYKITTLVRWISSKEIKRDSIDAAKLNAVEAICMVEKFFPTSILTIQMHLLVHVVDKVALAGTVHSRWMFFLEQFMKTLKGFVRQRARPEGSMAEGWLVQESLVFITEFVGMSDPEMSRLWSDDADARLIGDEPQGQGTQRKMDPILREKVMKFCILNSEPMQKWLERYELAKEAVAQERAERRKNRATQSLPLPDRLRGLPSFPTSRWLDAVVSEAKKAGEAISQEEEEFAKGCDWEVTISYIAQY